MLSDSITATTVHADVELRLRRSKPKRRQEALGPLARFPGFPWHHKQVPRRRRQDRAGLDWRPVDNCRNHPPRFPDRCLGPIGPINCPNFGEPRSVHLLLEK